MATEPNHVIGKEASRFYDYLHKGVLVFLFLKLVDLEEITISRRRTCKVKTYTLLVCPIPLRISS